MPHTTRWETTNLDHDADDQSQSVVSSSDPSNNVHATGECPCVAPDTSSLGAFRRRQSQQSILAQRVMTSQSSKMQHQFSDDATRIQKLDQLRDRLDQTLFPEGNPQNGLHTLASTASEGPKARVAPTPPVRPQVSGRGGGSLAAALQGNIPPVTGATMSMNDTPAHTAPSSPGLNGRHSDLSAPLSIGLPIRQNSGTTTPRVRPTTLDIPGLTKSKVSPDGRIAPRDVGSKLVIVMVGLPARGKSYITKKLARYLNWLQHDTRIFNVGERRRVVAGGPQSLEKMRSHSGRADRGFTVSSAEPPDVLRALQSTDAELPAAHITVNGQDIAPPSTPPDAQSVFFPEKDNFNPHDCVNDLHRPDMGEPSSPRLSRRLLEGENPMEHNASFFDPDNQTASQIREQVARETLDELLDFILDGNGSIGILDATNSTIERRKMVMDLIRARAGPDLNVLFLESRCVDPDLLEANMRLKLSGPDYGDMDPTTALEDFRKRVQAYEKAYVPLGDYEEKHHWPYIQMIDVGRKIISHQIKGFLMAQANYYLLNFNLAPRQIWITRHGLSMDNISGKIGGDSELAPEGVQYAKSLTRFMDQKRIEWDEKQLHSRNNSHFPPQPGDATPPNPHYHVQSPSARNGHDDAASWSSNGSSDDYQPKNFCVWTSMLKRSIQTAQYFDDEDYDTKQMRMLDELNAGVMEGLTYSCISSQFPDEYASRKQDKLHYRYPGPGGEGYLDIINRLRPVIVELERMTDHVLLVGHRSVSRVLLAYFRGLKREEVADLDVPLGMLYCLEPKPYGVDFHAYRWDKNSEWFYEVPDFQLQRAEDDMQ